MSTPQVPGGLMSTTVVRSAGAGDDVVAVVDNCPTLH